MYARVTTINVRPDKVEEAVGITSDSVLAAAKEQPGFKGMHLLSNRETCKGVAITFWETREHLEASEKSGYYGEQVDRFSEILTGPPEMEVFEVDI